MNWYVLAHFCAAKLCENVSEKWNEQWENLLPKVQNCILAFFSLSVCSRHIAFFPWKILLKYISKNFHTMENTVNFLRWNFHNEFSTIEMANICDHEIFYNPIFHDGIFTEGLCGNYSSGMEFLHCRILIVFLCVKEKSI